MNHQGPSETLITPESLVTFAYQRARRNVVLEDALQVGGELDMEEWPALFIHDCLMMPGSLASILGKESAEDVVLWMAPAVLKGHTTRVEAKTGLPCIIKDSDPTKYVKGMVLFGEGRKGRHKLDPHYHTSTRVVVEIDIETFRDCGDHMRKLVEKRVTGYAWVRQDVTDDDANFNNQFGPWILQEYLAGRYTDEDEEYTEDSDSNSDCDSSFDSNPSNGTNSGYFYSSLAQVCMGGLLMATTISLRYGLV